jgi:hypothetical protein
MVNIFFELDGLRNYLATRGVDATTIDLVVDRAHKEIEATVNQRGQNAVDEAVQLGAQKESADFINQVHFDTFHHEIATDSGQLNFDEPPRPMMPYLLRNAKPMKDGSGVYKVVPIGKPSKKPPFSKNIHDAQRRISAERIEEAKARVRNIAPAGSQVFRTVTSKQDPTTQWVQPAKEKDFTQEVMDINQNLRNSLSSVIDDIIESYKGMY